MSQDLRANLKQLLASGEIRLQPLSFPQRELWENSPVPADDVANHICLFIHLRGPVTREECLAALQNVVARQEVLRLSFLPGKEGPVQVIRANGPAVMRFRELAPHERNQETIEALMREVFQQPFDLLRGPVYRVEVFCGDKDDLLLVCAIHHSIADGWSVGTLVQDLVSSYIAARQTGDGALPPLPMSYSAWAAAERAYWQPAEIASRMEFWRPRLAGIVRLWERPAEPAERTGQLQRWVTAIPPRLTRTTLDLARATGITLFNTLLTAFQVTLAAWTGKDDIMVGTPVANRSKQAVRETIGYFAGVVPLRGRVDPSRPFAEAAAAVQQETMDSLANALPFAELVRAAGIVTEPGHNPIFDVRFALQNHPIPDVSLPGMAVKLRMRSTGTARFDLACEVTEDGEELEVVWLYRPSLFSATQIQELHSRYQSMLSAVSNSAHVAAATALA